MCAVRSEYNLHVLILLEAQPVEKMNAMQSAGRTGWSGYVDGITSQSLPKSDAKCMLRLNKARVPQPSQSNISCPSFTIFI